MDLDLQEREIYQLRPAVNVLWTVTSVQICENLIKVLKSFLYHLIVMKKKGILELNKIIFCIFQSFVPHDELFILDIAMENIPQVSIYEDETFYKPGCQMLP